MKILITGATGFVGANLCAYLKKLNHSLVAVSRDRVKAREVLGNSIDVIEWKDVEQFPERVFDGIDCVVNLAGENLASLRWTKSKKKKILSTRINTTKVLVGGIKKSSHKPELFINASAVGFYSFDTYGPVDEDSPCGSDFLAKVCWSWEEEAIKSADFGVRVVLIRMGMVLGKGGALHRIVIPFKWYLGSIIGNGEQLVSWIHMDDVLSIVQFVIDHEKLEGPINITVPNPLNMKDFMLALGNAIKRPVLFNVPAGVVKLILGEMASMLLASQDVLPKKLLDLGYEFKYSTLSHALANIYES